MTKLEADIQLAYSQPPRWKDLAIALNTLKTQNRSIYQKFLVAVHKVAQIHKTSPAQANDEYVMLKPRLIYAAQRQTPAVATVEQIEGYIDIHPVEAFLEDWNDVALLLSNSEYSEG